MELKLALQCVQSVQIECGLAMAESLVWLRVNNHVHDQPFLAISWWNSTTLMCQLVKQLHTCSKCVVSYTTTVSSMVCCIPMSAFGSCGMKQTQRKGY